jgi:hypothetical protein
MERASDILVPHKDQVAMPTWINPDHFDPVERQVSTPVPGHGCETVRCAGYAANLNSVAASDARAFCSALI